LASINEKKDWRWRRKREKKTYWNISQSPHATGHSRVPSTSYPSALNISRASTRDCWNLSSSLSFTDPTSEAEVEDEDVDEEEVDVVEEEEERVEGSLDELWSSSSIGPLDPGGMW
jgi:hypothetical protein